jgi:hypothetical protein
MTPLLSTMLFAATATAQVTTSFWTPNFAVGTDNIGFVGSVINANQTHTTIVVDFDEGTDTSALSIGGGPQTITIGPQFYGAAVSIGPSGGSDDDRSYQVDCEWPTPEEADSNRTCTISYSPAIARLFFCSGTAYASMSEEVFTRTHTYPARGSEPAGTETIKQTFSWGAGNATELNTEEPSFCSQSGLPEEGTATSVEIAATSISTYYLVITAGTEKLEATAAATPSLSSASSTGAGNASAVSGSAALPEATQAGAPMVTGAPMLVGLGAAVAAFLV